MASRSRTLDVGLAVLGLAGLAAFLLLYADAFPQASVDLEVTRDEAKRVAADYLGPRGAELDAYRSGTVFSGNTTALIFLQRTVGVDEASRYAREEVPIWSWSLRWFVPEEKEEWRAWVGVDGEIVGFRHAVEEAAEGASLEQARAAEMAESFLRERGWDLSAFERVEASTEELDNRTDHVFSWERRGSEIVWRPDDPEAGTGSIRLAVTVQGDEIGGYRHFLKVPEEFSRELSQTQSMGQLLAIFSVAATLILALVALGIAIVRYRADDIRWKHAFGAGGLVAAMMLIQSVTTWPSIKFSYPTQIQWIAFVGSVVFGLLLVVVVYGALVLFSAAAGESLGRQYFPETLRGYREAMVGKLLGPGMAAASLRGYGLGMLFLGYLTVFYVVARNHFGAWLPAEGPYSEIFNYYLPFVTPVAISVVAAVSEEVIYRLFGVGLFKKLLRSTALALLVPAAIWAFGHSTYPVFPVYLRGIELTIGGLLFGVAFLKFGLMTCIVAHYLVDAVFFGLPLLTSGNPTYLVAGIVVLALALVPAVLGLLARGRESSGGDTTGNGRDPEAGAPEEIEAGD